MLTINRFVPSSWLFNAWQKVFADVGSIDGTSSKPEEEFLY